MTATSYLLDLLGIRVVDSNGEPVPQSKELNFVAPLAAAYNTTTKRIDVTGGGASNGVEYETMDDLREVAPVNGIIARTSSFSVLGDGGGGTWRGVTGAAVSTYTHNGGTVIVPSGGNGSAAWLRDDSGPVKPEWFGARAGSGDPTSGTQSAINTAITEQRGAVQFGVGTWTWPCTTSLDPGAGNIAFVGAGKDATIFNVAEGTVGDELYLFRNNTTTRKGNLRFEGIKFVGTLESDERNNFGNPLYLDYYSRVEVIDCAFDQLAGPAMDFHSCLQFRCIGSDFTNLGRDGARCRDTSDCIVDNCTFRRLGDDAVALHTANYEVASDVAAGIAIRERLVITNNTLANCGSIKALGAKRTIIANNVGNLIRHWAIWVASVDGNEGTNPIHDIVIANNVFSNIFQSGGYLRIEVQPARGAAATGGAAPMRYDSGSASIIRPWEWYQSVVDDTDYAWPPAAGIHVSGNVFRRTAWDAAAFSEYGEGSRLELGISTDDPIADADWRAGIGLSIQGDGDLCGLLVEGNTFEHVVNAMHIRLNDVELGIRSGVIRGNRFHDARDYGLLFFPTFDRHVGLVIEDNEFDLDYYRITSNSNLNGTYDGASFPVGLSFGAAHGMQVRRNRFSNCCLLVQGTNLDLCLWDDNIAMVEPVQIAFSASNKGVGELLADPAGWRYIIADCDPTSATYGAISSVMQRTATAIPSAGWYYAGWFVQNMAATALGLRGWHRLTTGSSHTAGTDWHVVAIHGAAESNRGDNSVTLTPASSAKIQRWNSPLTANRTVTLSSTLAEDGLTWHIARGTAATGAFTLDVGGLKSLAPGEWCDVTYDTGSAAYILTAFGAL